MLPSTDKARLVNIHCIFNPSYVDSLDNDFFSSIEFSGGDGNKYKMNRKGFISFGKSLNDTLNDEQAYKEGINNFVVSHTDLQRLLDENSKFRDNTIIAVSNSNKDGASSFNRHYDLLEGKDNSSLDGLRKAIYNISHCIFSSNIEDRRYFLGEKNDDEKTIIKKHGSLMPCIHGSDAHTESKLFKPERDNYCWIKSNLNFEGLKQVLHEPADRVRIQANIPEQKSGYQVIDHVEIYHPDFYKQTIYLNENLNSIIGGRSTGKSLLLGTIAKKLHSHIEVKESNKEYSDYVNEVVGNIKVIWKDKNEDNNRDIEYIPQSYMYKLSKDSTELDDLIGRIIKQDKEKQEAIHRYEAACSDTSTEITNKVNKLFQLKSDNQTNRENLKEKGDEKGITVEIESLEVILNTLKQKSSISEKEIEKYTSLKDQYHKKSKKIEEREKIILNLRSLKEKHFINNDIDYELTMYNNNLSKKIKGIHHDLRNRFEQGWAESIEDLIKEISDKNEKNNNCMEKILRNNIYIKGNKYFLDNIQYQEVEDKVKTQKDKLSDIRRVKDIISQVDTQANKLILDLKDLHKGYFDKVSNLVSTLSTSRESLEIKASASFKLNKYVDLLKLSINQQSNKGQKLVRFEYDNPDEYFSHVFDIFHQVLKNELTLKGEFNRPNLCQSILSNNPFRISYDIFYEGDKFSQMSEGKKAFVILMLLLDFSDKNCPILIDQPEDDLDNRAIYNDLVRYLKNKKKERQIIIVTHNPNIAVGADSELIIVANQHGNSTKNIDNAKFQYMAGSLEHTMKKNQSNITLSSQGIREHVCEVLEGGDEAFKKRERQYAFA